MGEINKFMGKYSYLSNFYESNIVYEGLRYPSSENAFQAAKIHIPNEPEVTNNLRVNTGFTVISAGQSKRVGRKVSLRKDWDEVRDSVMLDILKGKFTGNEELGKALIETGNSLLVEGNTWHDNYWGDCSCDRCKTKTGENKLGKLLMEIRSSL